MTRYWQGKLITGMLLLASGAILVGCGDSGETDGDGEAPQTTPVEVAEASRDTVEAVEETVGIVETFSHPRVAAEVAGRLVAAEADVGDQVAAGDVLARIEREPYELSRNVARSEIGRLEAQVERLQLDRQRVERLSEREYATEQDADAVAAELQATREQLQSARVRLQQAERDLRLTEIVSPVDGVVDERLISEGSYVTAGEPAFRVQPLDRFRARIAFPEYVGSRLQKGMPVVMQPRDSMASEVTGEISRIRPAVDAATRAVEIIVDFENPGDWRPGITVDARVVLERRENAVRVPALSIVRRPAGEVVYLVDGDTVSEQRVRIGRRTPDWVEIREGLTGGETVVTDGADYLTDGAHIRVREDG